MKIAESEIIEVEGGTSTINVVEVWCVGWQSLHWRTDLARFVAKNETQLFLTEESASRHKGKLERARRLLCDSEPRIHVYKHVPPSNV